jgi:hypothetical protein
MNRYPIFVVISLLVGLAALGCGSDDKGTQPTITATQKYQALQFPLNEVFDYMFGKLRFDRDALDNFDPYQEGLGPLAATGSASDTITYIYLDGWHIINTDSGFEYGNMTLVDSIRFTDSQGQPQKIPSRWTTAAMHIIEHMDLTYFLDPWTGTSSAYLDLSYTGLQSSSVMVDGTGIIRPDLTASVRDEPYDWDVTCGVDLHDVTISNPVLFGREGCVDGGSLGMTISGSFSVYDNQGKYISGNVNATGTVAFNADRTADITITIGGSQFQDSVATCESI